MAAVTLSAETLDQDCSDDEDFGPLHDAIAALSAETKTRGDIAVKTAVDYEGRRLVIHKISAGVRIDCNVFRLFNDELSQGDQLIGRWREILRKIRRAKTSSQNVTFVNEEDHGMFVFEVRLRQAEFFSAADCVGMMSCSFSKDDTADLLELLDEAFSEWIAAGEQALGPPDGKN